MSIFLTSDLHFYHDRDFIYEPRGFKSVYEMNEVVLDNINTTVSMDDDLYILGDLMLNNDNAGIRLIKSLKGRLHVILGNHDSATRQALYRDCYNIVDVKYADMIKADKKEFYLSHYPTCIGNFDEKHGPYCLCGHTHTQDKFSDIDKRCYHIELDAHDNKPVSIEEIIDDIKRRKEKCK